MDFSLSEEQEMLKTMARDFLEKECPESVVRDIEEDEDGYSPELWHKIADLGWLGLIYPEKYGGTGGSILDIAVLCEEMGRAIFPSPYLSTVVLCGQTILAAGSEEQKADLLPRIVSGDLILALALTEPESSWDGKAWDAEGVAVRATPDGDEYVIDGIKLFVHDAHVADHLLCVTRTRDSGPPEEGITLFLVDTKSPGINYTLLKTEGGDNKQSEVVLDKVRVPKKNIVGELNGGWAPLARAMQVGTVMLCAEMVGAGQRILELTVDYAQNRIQFDMPIGIHQLVQDYCVQILKDVDGSRWATYLAAWALGEGLPCDLEVAIDKAWTSDAHERSCWRAHQVFAGIGSTVDHILPLYTRRGNTSEHYLGNTRYHMEKVAQQLEALPPPKKPKGKPLGLWDPGRKEGLPTWSVWSEYYEGVQRRIEEKRKLRASRPL
jgi:alkylation response protein AidB-like acyl-CoA dehydrogenase